MSRWSSVLPGRGRRSGSGPRGRSPGDPAVGAGRAGVRAAGGPPVEDVDGVFLVRSIDDDSFPLDLVAEVAAAVGGDTDVVTVVVASGTGEDTPDADRWRRLGSLLDSLRARGTGRLRLVLSGAGLDRPDRPCVARRIADAWDVEVTAPDGPVLITPGGTLFVHGDPGAPGAWWRFTPGAPPRRLGRRAPAPDWEEAVEAGPARTAGGCAVERIPAGVLIRPAEAPGPAADDLCFSVPVDADRPTVLVGTPRADDVPADEVAAVLAELPASLRARARLAPGGPRDLLPLGQSVADLLGGEVEVLTGLPLLDTHAPPGTEPRPTLVGTGGTPGWRPFVSSVVCGPADPEGRTPAPRPVGSRLPDGLPGGTEPGTVRLTDRWQVVPTRAGLALRTPDGPRPEPSGQAVDPEVCAVELGTPGQPLDDTLIPALSLLLRALASDTLARTTLLVRGRLLAGDGELRRLAAEHGIPGIRYVTTARPARPAAVRHGRATATGSGAGAPAHGERRAPAPGESAATGSPERLPVSTPEEADGEVAGQAVVGRGAPSRGTAVAATGGSGGAGSTGDGSGGAGSTEVASGAVGSPGNGSTAAGQQESTRSPAGTEAPAREVPESATPPEAPRTDGAAQPAGRPSTGTRTRTGAGSGTGAGAGTGEPAPGASGASGAGATPGGGRDGGNAPGGDRRTGGRPVVESGSVPPSGRKEARQRNGTAEAGAVTGSPSGATARAARPPATSPAGPRTAGDGDANANGNGEPTAGRSPAVHGSGAATGPVRASGTDGDRTGAGTRPEGDAAGRAATPGPDFAPPSEGTGAAPGSGRATTPAWARPAAPGRNREAAGSPPRAAGLPFVPGHVSGAAERAAFRDLAAGAWEKHAAAVSRLLTRMPALRGHELDAARVDLVAVHAYLTAEEGPLHHREVIRDLHTGAGLLLPYAGCLASALRRLPSYRGVALRGGDPAGPVPEVGTLLHDPAPVSALAGTSALPSATAVRHAIWSVTGRKVRQLLVRPGDARAPHEEIVFAPGTGFRVLGVRTDPAGPSVVLLRELHGQDATVRGDEPEELSGPDLKALSHLEEALARGFRTGGAGSWPERCSGPVGRDG
ncbi:hypothetical protein ACFUIW_09715 [Streptomyces sp. NPDC057245]|uniref:hypothetical protein n=1 Tax=Streptomyces sp. NPDC057245 TaxID=3346065 RepID=UPI003644BCA7